MEQPVLEAKAVQRHLRKAPRKVRLVADSVRGKGVDVAIKQLEFLKKGASIDVAKVINQLRQIYVTNFKKNGSKTKIYS